MNRDSSNIVVSGLGLVTPLGNGREKTWRALLNGETGIRSTPQGLEAQVLDFSLNGARSRMGDFALLAAEEAILHAGFTLKSINDFTVGCAVSQSKPILATNLDPSLLLASFFGWSAEEIIRNKFLFSGPSANVVAACATGIASIDLGASWIRDGICDVSLVGASESSLNAMYRSGFEQMGVLVHGSPHDVSPFDRNRSGFAMGEGAAVLILEKEESALKRGHKPLAWLGRTVLRHSANDSVRFDHDGASAAQLLMDVCEGHAPDYINAHGTGTRLNDAVETKGIKMAFGPKSSEIKISSTKAATGHLLGAAGAVEAGFCVLALRDQVAPPTLNLSAPDAECDLDYVPDVARRWPISKTVSLSYGFGGQMGAVSFEKYGL